MLDRTVELLFKYRPEVFAQGELRFLTPPLWLGVLAVLALVVLLSTWRYGRGSGGSWGLAALRALLLALVLFCLARPALVVSTVEPQESFVAVLVDDSRSMQIADAGGGETRAQVVRRLLAGDSGRLLSELGERFKVRLFGFHDDARRVESVDELDFSGAQSSIGGALVATADELATVPLTGIVLLSDGVDSSRPGRDELLRDLRRRELPVYTVGLGSEHFDRELQVDRVDAPVKVLKGSRVEVEVTISQAGYSGREVTLEVEDQGRLVSTETIAFPASGEAVIHKASFAADAEGPRRFTFRVPPRDGEQVTENNTRTELIQVVDRVEKILYFEGEPRYNVKFMRRAVEDDENLQLVVLQRNAENRFGRFGLDKAGELEDGFPTSREELFAYKGLILGSVEASFFTYEQLRNISDFTSRRGGGFMMLGGRNAFAEGGYKGTPIEDLLPVRLGAATGGEGELFFAEMEVELTNYGRSHPAVRLSADEGASAMRWSTLPAVHTFNPISQLKPGATALLTGRGAGLSAPQVVLAHQRYGRGKSLAWTVRDDWLWQMHADIPLEDQTHETLWKQLLRWMASDVPDPVDVHVERPRLLPGDQAVIVADVVDASFLAVNNAAVSAEVRSPSGERQAVQLAWTGERDGEYRGRLKVGELGIYEVDLGAELGSRSLGTSSAFFEVAGDGEEFFDATQRSEYLQRLAEETGGKYYTAANVGNVAEDMALRQAKSTRFEEKELWDMPLVFLLLVGGLVAEWGLRRRRGLA